MNFKRKLLYILISFSIIIPINTFAYSKYLIPGGENVGITIKSDGAYVVGFYDISSRKSDLKIGDRIISINDEKISTVNELVSKINSHEKRIAVKIGYIRNNEYNYTTLHLKQERDGTYKTGIYVKDTITGIGTLTFIDPEDNTFGALGHEIVESNANVNFYLKSGNILEANITSVKKSVIGTPGEKNASLNFQNVYGNISYNMETGIYGKLKKNISEEKMIPVASLDEVKIGTAEIITVIEGNKKETFDIEILSIDNSSSTRNFTIKITSKDLINKTGGIIKGMSGSPIIQDGKIVGAITHTVIDNPTKGYGISIIKMLESIE